MQQRGDTARLAVAGFLAIAATCTSVGIAIIAGRERGGTYGEQAAWIAIGVVTILSAHLIPAIARQIGPGARVVTMCVWALSVVATGYTHATFFFHAQKDAGEARAAAVDAVPVASSGAGRLPNVIAGERAKLQQELVYIGLHRCTTTCAIDAARTSVLHARLDALNVELADSQRRQRLDDLRTADQQRLQARRDAEAADPVIASLSAALHERAVAVELGMSLLIGWLLEAIGCIAWLATFAQGGTATRSARKSDVVFANAGAHSPDTLVQIERCPVYEAANEDGFGHSPVVDTVECGAKQLPASADQTAESDEALAERLITGLQEGRLRPSIDAIRAYLQCSEARALAFRRKLSQERPDLLSSRGLGVAAAATR